MVSRERSLDPSRIPVPETPGTSVANGLNDEGNNLELIGQELVVRTIHQSSHQPSPIFQTDPISPALVTPTRMVTRATRALTSGTVEGSVGDEGEREFAIQPLVYPKGSPEVFGPGTNTPGTGGQLPLFTQDQLGRLHDLQRQAPLLYGGGTGVPLAQQIGGTNPMTQMSSGLVSGGQGDGRSQLEDLRQIAHQLAQRNQLLAQEVQQLERANVPLRAHNFSLKEENEILKLRLSLFDVQAGTPVFASPDQGETGPNGQYTVGYEIPENAQVVPNAQVTSNDLFVPNAPVIQNAQVTSNDLFAQNVQVLPNDIVTPNNQAPVDEEVPEVHEFDLSAGVQDNMDGQSNKAGKQGGLNYIPDELFGKNYGKGSQGPSASAGVRQPATGVSSADANQPQGDMIQLMAKMMEGMTNLQKQIMDGKENEPENVRSNLELPQLTEWSASSGPVDLSDWLCVIEPLMADLSNSSSEWWTTVMKEAQSWYEAHLRLQPLDRVSHDPQASPVLAQKKWVRLERRASSMLLMSVPKSLREELISTKRVSVLSIICHLMMLYQPGGLAEKELILRQLESPPESQSLSEAVQGLRRWSRWRRRATDLGVQEPDPFLLLKGLNRLTRKSLEQHRDLSFRISLARSTLQVDSTPTSRSVTSFALHLIAEFEQVVYHETQAASKRQPAPLKTLKAKKMEIEDDKGRGKPADREEQEPVKCKFYLTQAGCKKGKDCRFSHDQKDDQRRCYVCGSTEHLVPTCPRRKGDQYQRQQPKSAKAEVVEDPMKEETSAAASSTDAKSNEPTVKSLLEEATKVLKTMTAPTATPKPTSQSSDPQRDQLMSNLQKQLDQLRATGSTSMKVLKLSRLATGSLMGLIDSGATHALRPLHPHEDGSKMVPVEVTLADGNKKELLMTKEGTMVTSSPNVEPIVPMGVLTSKLGCEVLWCGDRVMIRHPTRGELDVDCVDGCPMIKRSLALELIEEAENLNRGPGMSRMTSDQELCWINQLVDSHPVLRQLPAHIRSSLTSGIGSWKDIPVNKRLRKRFQKGGFSVHLFAGPDQGQTLKRTFKQLGGPPDNLLELDVLRDPRHDFLANDGIYGGLLRAAMDNKLLAILGGPNCRTRSVLRHRPIEGQENYPRPVRAWEDDQVYGLLSLDPEELKKVQEDDVMLWRMVFLYMVATYVDRACPDPRGDVGFLLEQPASPRQYQPDCVSLWDQQDWKKIAEEFQLQHCTLKQGDFGGMATKPTTFANNLDLQPVGSSRRSRSTSIPTDSKELSRWAPGVMHLVALVLKNKIYNKVGSLRAMTWKEHVDHQHYPFRRDCQVCQESLQRDLPHKKVKHPLSGVLSADTSGPFHLAPDAVGKAKYMLVATLTWMVPKSSPLKEPEDEADPVPPEAPEIEDLEEEEQGEEQGEVDHQKINLLEEEIEAKDPSTGALGNSEDETRDSGGCDPEASEEPVPDDFEIRTYRMACPLSSKSSKEVMQSLLELYLRLKIDGFVISRFHTDRGREFSNQLRRWFISRGVICTRTAGDNPQSNGRCEVAVQNIKTLVRRALLQAKAGPDQWPWALRHLNECLREHRMERSIAFPNFLQSVLVNKRTWKNRQFEAVKEAVQYLCPAWCDHGHWVRKEGEPPMITRYVLRNLENPPTEANWIALERDGLDSLTIRRRIRGKTTVRKLCTTPEGGDIQGEEEEEEELWKTQRLRILKVVEEEMLQLVNDEEDVAVAGMQVISKIRKLTNIETEEEEVLQTRVISPKEVNQQWREWVGPAKDEVRSMLEEKQALRPVKKEELDDIMSKARERNRRVELIPSKLVFTKKPAPPPKGHKNKVRWVVCGNYESKREDEENYSGGADAAAFRIMVHQASKYQWHGASVDVRTAFLNAEMNQSQDDDLVLVKPPYHLVERGVLDKETMYEPLKAVYGFRRSPRLWGLCRDDTLSKMTFAVNIDRHKKTLVLSPLESEPNLWMIKERQDGFDSDPVIYGLLMTYVDDTFVVGTKVVVDEVLKNIQETWATSDPEVVSSTPIKFLGMEVSKHFNENINRHVWRINQESYLKDLLAKEENLKVKLVPITKDQASWSEPTTQPTTELIRQAQREVGSLLWLVTRTRPDIMFAVAKLSSLVTRDPQKALEISTQIKGYLKGTLHEGLEFLTSFEKDEVINSFSDASYAPEGDYSHGSTVVLLQQSPILWKSGKQAVATLSTAEAELLEAVEALTMGESIYVIVKELEERVSRVAWCDSQAAVSILTNEGGSWRTRHLRIRASFARSAIKQGCWLLHHVAGIHMVADIGTKVLTAARMEFLKKLLGMRCCFPEVKEKEISPDSPIDQSLVIQAVRVLAIAALLDVADAANHTHTTNESKNGEIAESEEDFQWLLYVYTIIVVFMTLAVVRCCGWLEPQIHRGFDLVKACFGSSPTPSSTSTTSPTSKVLPSDLSHPQGRGSRGIQVHDSEVCQHEGSPQFRDVPDHGLFQGPQGPADLSQQDVLKQGGLDQSQTPRVTKEAPISSSTPISTSRLRSATQAEASSSSMSINIGGIQLELGETATPFRPLVMRHGSAYHTDENCKYLKAKFTGISYGAELCDLCAAVIRREGRIFPQRGDVLKGDPLSYSARGTMKFHMENCCNHRGPFTFLTYCAVCAKKE